MENTAFLCAGFEVRRRVAVHNQGIPFIRETIPREKQFDPLPLRKLDQPTPGASLVALKRARGKTVPSSKPHDGGVVTTVAGIKTGYTFPGSRSDRWHGLKPLPGSPA
jgi:hypothetical protein